jgi:hypothetical protein
MRGQFRGIEHTPDVNINDAQIGLRWLLVVTSIRKDFVLAMNTRIGYDMGNPPRRGEKGSLTKEVDLITPLADIAANEFRPLVTTHELEEQACELKRCTYPGSSCSNLLPLWTSGSPIHTLTQFILLDNALRFSGIVSYPAATRART